MFRKMTAVTTALAISIMLAACGGEKGTNQTEPPGARAAPAAEARAETNARTPGSGGNPRAHQAAATQPQPHGRRPQGPGSTRPRPGPRPQEAPGESSGKTRKQGTHPAATDWPPLHRHRRWDPDWPPC